MNPRLLVVDDELEIRNLLSELLSESYTVDIAANSKEALEKVKNHKPDIILMDLMMPQVDGIETSKRIRSLSYGKSIPILVLTALSTSQVRANAYSIGVDDFISKPFEIEELKVRISS